MLCGGRVNAITVTVSRGGQVEATSNFLVRLAPYCLPLFCIACLSVMPFLQHQARTASILLAGLAYGNYLRGNFPHIGIQPDIKRSGGRLVAYPVIMLANICVLTGIAFVLRRW